MADFPIFACQRQLERPCGGPDQKVCRVTEFMADKTHPGKDRKSGYFGFAGHHDPVMFRNISIEPLH